MNKKKILGDIIVKLKKGSKVRDRWFKCWGVGVVEKVLKTRFHINFNYEGVVVFDKPHAKMFLELVKKPL